MKRLTVVGLVLGIMMMAVCAFGSAVPQVINYSGTLTNKVGAAVPDGTYDIEFTIYNVPSAGTSLWTEKWSSTAIPSSPVLVTGGVFNVMLGTIAPFPNGFFADNPNTYLGIKVGADSEMLPRQKIASVGYAFAAGNGVPKGGVIMWSGVVTAIPDGWALCDGNNGTPNLKDKFIVGAGGSYGVAATGGEALHTLVINEMPSHNHGGLTGGQSADHSHSGQLTSVNRDGSSGTRVREADPSGTNGGVNYTTGGASNDHVHGIAAQGGGAAFENRPPYYALAFIMKL